MTPAINITAPDVLCAFLNYRIMRPGPFNPIEVGNIQVFWADGLYKADGFCRRRTPPVEGFVRLTLPGFAVDDQILPQIHRKK
jgi:hypothetical protein